MSYYNSIDESHKYPLPPSHEIISYSSRIPPSIKNNNDDSGYKVQQVKIKVEEVKNDIANNIEKVLSRGEKLEDTERRALSLENSSNIFQKRSRRLKCMFCTRSVKLLGCIVFCIFIVLLLIFILVYSMR